MAYRGATELQVSSMLCLTTRVGMAASRKAASAAPANKAPNPMRMPGAPCNAILASTCWHSFLCFIGLPLEERPCGCLHAT